MVLGIQVYDLLTRRAAAGFQFSVPNAIPQRNEKTGACWLLYYYILLCAGD